MEGKTIYLASPLGFSLLSRERLLPLFVQELEQLGLTVLEPFQRNSGIDVNQPGWAYGVAQQCLRDVRDADGVFAIVNGTPPDEGVMVEVGMAFALGKPVFLFRDDFRRCTDSDHYPLNLMVFAGLPEHGWEAYVHESVASIADPHKALARWAAVTPSAEVP
ncbi:MAG: nucleoside 2-deoxyribosyltransferase [Synechococcus sp.]